MKPFFTNNKDLKSINLPHYDYFNESLCHFGNHIQLEYYKENFNEINWFYLSHNPNAIHILEKNLNKIDWKCLSSNPNAIPILENNLDKIVLQKILVNPNLDLILDKLNKNDIINLLNDHKCIYTNAVIFRQCNCITHFLDEMDPKYINWTDLSQNQNAISFLEKNLDKVDWDTLSENTNAIHILEKNLDKINYICLCKNINAISILEKNLDKVDWWLLSINENSIQILEKNLDKIDYNGLSVNKNGIHILEKNLDKICWSFLAQNINALDTIFINNKDELDQYIYIIRTNPNCLKLFLKLNYEKMKENNTLFVEELVSKVFHPQRLVNLCHEYNMTFDEINDCY